MTKHCINCELDITNEDEYNGYCRFCESLGRLNETVRATIERKNLIAKTMASTTRLPSRIQ